MSESINKSVSDEAVYKTAPATPGLLTIYFTLAYSTSSPYYRPSPTAAPAGQAHCYSSWTTPPPSPTSAHSPPYWVTTAASQCPHPYDKPQPLQLFFCFTFFSISFKFRFFWGPSLNKTTRHTILPVHT